MTYLQNKIPVPSVYQTNAGMYLFCALIVRVFPLLQQFHLSSYKCKSESTTLDNLWEINKIIFVFDNSRITFMIISSLSISILDVASSNM